jgi:conserved hypothetical protein
LKSRSLPKPAEKLDRHGKNR